MRERDGEVVEGGGAIVRCRGRGGTGKWSRSRLTRRSKRVDEGAGALLAGLPGHVDGVADDRRGGHAIQMEELKDRAAEDVEDLGIQPRHGAPAELGDDVVERALPPERAGDDLARERAIAFVRQPRTGAGERVGQVGGFVETARSASYAASRAGAIRRSAGQSSPLDFRAGRDVTAGQELARGHGAAALGLNR